MTDKADSTSAAIFIAASLARRTIGTALERTLTVQPTNTMPRNLTLQKTKSLQRTGTWVSNADAEPREAPYITFDAIVGRNSHFKSLTSAQEEELGGVEYRALSTLWKIVAGYWLGFQLIAVLLIAPYLSQRRFAPIFDVQGGIVPTWYVFINVWSAFSNNGMR